MRNKSNQSRVTARISSKLEKNLVAYMAAAGAAGVSLLAAQPVEAKVVYTATNTAVGNGTPIDLNNDGVADFTLGFHVLDKSIVLTVDPIAKGNGVLCAADGGAAAGFFGVPVGAGEKFVRTNGYSWGVVMADAGSYSVTWFNGPWANATNRYLGLRFVVDGQTHYGWARLTVPDYIHGNPVVLTGYAYETTPNKTILDGHTSGPEKSDYFAPSEMLAPVSQPASLGVLARGADSLAIWRRDEEILTQ
ncbi:MAG TPA: hypothetical protein VIH89_01835 [Candidatus Sulfotelmatobacter sp.]